MDEKQRLEMAGIDARDWDRTPASVRQLVVQLSVKLEQLEQHLKELQASNEQLCEKVNRNSENSHSPPASDGLNIEKGKKKKPTGKKRGGQPGHPGHSRPLYPVEACNSVSDYYPETCAGCGKALQGVDSNPYRHQVLEIPPTKLHIEEHRLHQLNLHSLWRENQSGPPGRSRVQWLFRESGGHRLSLEWDVSPFSKDGGFCDVRLVWSQDVTRDCQSSEKGRERGGVGSRRGG
jgi:hypothetical protein